MAHTLLSGLTHKVRQKMIKHIDRLGWNALQRAALGGRTEVADLIIRYADTEDRESVVRCVDDDGGSLLHKAFHPLWYIPCWMD